MNGGWGGEGEGHYMQVTQEWTFTNLGLNTLISSTVIQDPLPLFFFFPRNLHSCIVMRVRVFMSVYLFVFPARKSLIALSIVAVTMAAWASLGGPRGRL